MSWRARHSGEAIAEPKAWRQESEEGVGVALVSPEAILVAQARSPGASAGLYPEEQETKRPRD